MPVRFNQPVPVVARVEPQEREAQPSPSGSRTNAGRDAKKGQLVLEAIAASRRKGVGYTCAGNVRFYRFDIVVEQEPDDEGYAAHSRMLPGSVSSGKTFEEANRNIREAIQQHIEALPAHGHRILQNERLGHVEERTIGVP